MRIGVVLGLLIALVLTGCKRPENQLTYEPPPIEDYLNSVAGAYIKFTQANKRPPKNEQELLPVLKEWGEPPEKFLTSPRDNEAFIIVWDVDFLRAPTRDGMPPIFAYERTGVGGKRYTSNFREANELTPEQFKTAHFPAGHTPQ